MTRNWGRIVVVAGVIWCAAPVTAARAGTECDDLPDVCGAAHGTTITVGASQVNPGAPGVAGVASSAVGADTVTFRDFAPTCVTNGRGDDGLCTIALEACADPGATQYWEWTKVVDRTTGAVVQDWVKQPGSVCLGPRDPALDPSQTIAALVQQEFADAVVLKANVFSSPKGTTLVNYDTGFYTDTRDYEVTPSLVLLGRTVRVFAHPSRYDWDFGDGGTALDAGPGSREGSDVRHTYRDTGAPTVRLTVTWTGEYSVSGGARRPVFGTATTVSNPTPLQVKQARAELVAG